MTPKQPDSSRGMEDAYGRRVLSATPRLFAVLLVTGTVALVLGVALGSSLLAPADPASTGPPNPIEVTNATNGNGTTYSTLYQQTHGSVVSVYVTLPDGTSSQGTGFVYDSQNHIVTNQHVIAGGETIHVRYAEGEWANATVVGTDPYTDLAVLQVDSRPDYADPMYVESTLPTVGEEAAVIGSPDNLEGSLTVGVVSGLNRSMVTSQEFVIPDTIQTDASLNNGNSGGPVFDMDGNVIGIARARQGDNIGFAISGRLVNTIVPSLLEDGVHEHSFVGVRATPMTPTLAQANDIPLRTGLLVTEVMDGSPSEGVLRGGNGETLTYQQQQVYKGGDVLLKVDGVSLTGNERLTSHLMRETAPGDTVTFTILRDGEVQNVSVTLGKRPAYGSGR